MIWIKVVLFIGTILSVKYIFSSINNDGDEKIEKMKELGYSEGYLYPHDFPGHYVEQQYLPDKMLGTKYYKPDENVKNE